MNSVGCLKQSLRTALKRQFSGISITVNGGKQSSAVNIRTTTKKCMVTDN